MRLGFVYTPTTDVEGTSAFYRDVLGLDESWREGDDTIAFRLPGTDADLMVSTTDQSGGPMFEVDDLTAWLEEHGELTVVVERYPIPNGSVMGIADPAGNTVYVYDQIDR